MESTAEIGNASSRQDTKEMLEMTRQTRGYQYLKMDLGERKIDTLVVGNRLQILFFIDI